MKNEVEARRQKPAVNRDTTGTAPLPSHLCRRLFFLVGLLTSSILHHPSCFAQQSKLFPRSNTDAPHGALTYESFRLLHSRNVFDPDRRPVRPANAASNAPVGRADYLALTGTLIDNDKTYAFFSGSRADFNKVLSVRDKIANATITQITPNNIVVERGGKSVNVLVGQTVPLDDKSVPGAAPSNFAEVTATGIDRPAGTGDIALPSSAASPAPGAAPTAGTAKSSASSPEEIMRKMMERRKQELK